MADEYYQKLYHFPFEETVNSKQAALASVQA
jgi:hypothetical protein